MIRSSSSTLVSSFPIYKCNPLSLFERRDIFMIVERSEIINVPGNIRRSYLFVYH